MRVRSYCPEMEGPELCFSPVGIAGVDTVRCRLEDRPRKHWTAEYLDLRVSHSPVIELTVGVSTRRGRITHAIWRYTERFYPP